MAGPRSPARREIISRRRCCAEAELPPLRQSRGNGGQEAETALIPRSSPLANAPEVLWLLFSRYFRPFYAIAIIDACVENAYYFGLWRSCGCALRALGHARRRLVIRHHRRRLDCRSFRRELDNVDRWLKPHASVNVGSPKHGPVGSAPPDASRSRFGRSCGPVRGTCARAG